jgi:hypothetical protein
MRDGLRLLPWTTPDGKPCYLDPDTAHPGPLSLLADSVEVSQLGSAEEVLAGSRAVLGDEGRGAGGAVRADAGGGIAGGRPADRGQQRRRTVAAGSRPRRSCVTCS